MLFLSSFALAADLSLYPLCAPVALPPTGSVRLTVPIEMRSGDDPQDGSSLLLLDDQDRQIPAYRLVDTGADQPIAASLEPTDDPFRFLVDLGALPVEELRVEMPLGVPPAKATVLQNSEALSEPTLVWRLTATYNDHVPIRVTTGRVELMLEPTQGSSLGGGPVVRAVTRRTHVPFTELELPVGNPVQQEDGWTRYDIVLPQILPVSQVVMHAHDAVFERSASLQSVAWLAPGEAAHPLYASNPQTVSRVRVGELSVESTRVEVVGGASDRLALLIEDGGLPPLQIERVTVKVPGAELAAQDVGTGPFRLCGGAPPGSTPVPAFAEAGSAEIAASAKEVAVPGTVEPNPTWQPPEERSGLAVPGRPFDEHAFRWKRPIEGAGLVRLALPNDMLVQLRSDLGDVRVSSQGRLVPHLLRPTPSDPVLEGVEIERQERGEQSRIRVKLPQAGLQVQRIVLWTDATVFSRVVEIGRPNRGTQDVLRYVEWRSAEQPTVLALSLDTWQQHIDQELIVTLHNGDDPPLPVTKIEVQVAGWEVLAVIPEEGADLVYGAASVAPPEYDLGLIAQDLRHRATATATLGPAEAIHKLPLGTLDRLLLGAGVAVLALGLAALLFDLVRRLPTIPDPSGTPAETSEVS